MQLRNLVIELLAKGHTEASLAKVAGCSQPTIHRIKKGVTKNPGYDIGIALTQLHQEQCGEQGQAA